ncbi:MAG: pyridoxal-phosphate dependent enzyme, partial [Candidatus Schekmanbacteria bacterium]|nr:pyridoxal-phosphate dependent enzyme [Candidatus Schekmanbacteria bacterium]
HSYGTEVIYSSPFEGSDGALQLVRKIYQDNPGKYFMPAQYDNPSNWMAHYDTTGVEIFEQTHGQITHFTAGLGTSGTVMGTGRRLKAYDSKIQVWAIEPDNSFHGIEGLKHMPSAIKPGIYDPSWLDGIIPVSTEDAYHYAHLLARVEGYLVGHSAGAALKGALDLAEKIKEGIIVTIFPDRGDRYLSVCHQISENSEKCNECEQKISPQI